MTKIKPSDIKIWDYPRESGPTGNEFVDLALIVVLMLAQQNDDWRPFSAEEFDAIVGYEFPFFADLNDLEQHGFTFRAEPNTLGVPFYGRYQLTDEIIRACHEHSPANPPARS